MRTLLLITALCAAPALADPHVPPYPRPTQTPELYRYYTAPLRQRERETRRDLYNQALREKIASEREQRVILRREFGGGSPGLSLREEILFEALLNRE